MELAATRRLHGHGNRLSFGDCATINQILQVADKYRVTYSSNSVSVPFSLTRSDQPNFPPPSTPPTRYNDNTWVPLTRPLITKSSFSRHSFLCMYDMLHIFFAGGGLKMGWEKRWMYIYSFRCQGTMHSGWEYNVQCEM